MTEDTRHGPDDLLVEQLRAAANRLDPPPEALAVFARAALAWRTVDAELAELAYDSAVDDTLVGAVRATTQAPRLLTFAADGVTVEVEVTGHGGLRRLAGQVVPMQPARIDIRHGRGVTNVECDILGRFDAEGLPAGPVSLRCELGDQDRVVHTDWSAI